MLELVGAIMISLGACRLMDPTHRPWNSLDPKHQLLRQVGDKFLGGELETGSAAVYKPHPRKNTADRYRALSGRGSRMMNARRVEFARLDTRAVPREIRSPNTLSSVLIPAGGAKGTVTV